MSNDPELEAIRQRRIAELMARSGQGPPISVEDQERQEEAKAAAEDQRQAMLAALLHSSARERLSRIALVKPDKARRVEDIIINAAKRGSLSGKVTEEALIGLLEQINEQTASKTKVTIQRRRMFDDED